MGLGLSIAAAVVAASSFGSQETTHFPGSYYDETVRPGLHRRAMEKWPGPAQIVDRWRAGGLEKREKVAVLLGMSASHDRVLLPLYREALLADVPRLRMAAAYGYRELIGDALPNVSGGVSKEAATALVAELDAVAATLRERPLVEMWLQSLMMTENASMPGWRGVAMRRSTRICLAALEKLVQPEDIQLLAAAWDRAERPATRFGLMRLLEAVALKVFFVQPTGSRGAWGSEDVDEAMEAVDDFLTAWLDHRCVFDADRILAGSANELGALGVQPLDPNAWDFWLAVLKQGPPQWRMMAARRLYDLGGRYSELSLFEAESAAQVERYENLLEWYRVGVQAASGRQGPPQGRTVQ